MFLSEDYIRQLAKGIYFSFPFRSIKVRELYFLCTDDDDDDIVVVNFPLKNFSLFFLKGIASNLQPEDSQLVACPALGAMVPRCE